MTNHKLIHEMKPAQRRDETNRQISEALARTTLDGVAEVTWRPSSFDSLRTQLFRIHGTSDALDSNGRESLLLTEPDGADGKWLTIGLHMVGRIAPVMTP
jgi:hypothetical protein